MSEFPLKNTIALVAECFVDAEANVRQVVKNSRPNADEAAITNDLERALAELAKFDVPFSDVSRGYKVTKRKRSRIRH
jgi:hypothetical protein